MFESPLESKRHGPKAKGTSKALLALTLVAVVGILVVCMAPAAYAGSLQNAPLIFDVRRSLPLEPDEPVFHDFYINAGAEVGFKKGLLFNVVRVISVHDPIQNKQQGELQVNVGRLQVLQVSSTMTVARLISEFSDEERPTLEYESVMVGDRVDLTSLTAEPVKDTGKKKHKAARAESGHERETVDVRVAERGERDVAAPPENKPESKPENKPESRTDNKSETGAQQKPDSSSDAKSEAQPPNAPSVSPPLNPATAKPQAMIDRADVKSSSPGAKSPDMVRVPVPAASDKL